MKIILTSQVGKNCIYKKVGSLMQNVVKKKICMIHIFFIQR